MTIALAKPNHFTVNLKIINRCLILLLLLCFGAYLVLANSLVVKGFAFTSLNKQKNQLLTENTELEVRSSNLRAYQNMTERLVELGLVKTENVRYVYQMSNVSYLP